MKFAACAIACAIAFAIAFAMFILSFSMSTLCLAQESSSPVSETAVPEVPVPSEQALDQTLLPQFVLVKNSTMHDRLHDLLKNNVTVFNRPAEKINQAELRLLRFAVRRQIAGVLATEGYFSPVIKFTNEFTNEFANKVENQSPDSTSEHGQHVTANVNVNVNVDPGPPTKVTDVQINFVGDAVPEELQQTIRSKWSLKKGAIFRDEKWSQAKARVIDRLNENSYAAAKLSNSEALIFQDQQNEQAELTVLVDSGPAFRIGDLHIEGLKTYQPWLLERYRAPVKGDLYNRANLLKFQRELQNSPYFSTVEVSIDPNPDIAAAVPVTVLVQERKKYDVGLAAGYSTNTGMRGEISFQDRNFFGDAWYLKSALRIEQLRKIAYADIYLPPKPNGYLDSVGVLFKKQDIEGLFTQASSFGAKRVITENSVEKRLGLSFIYEQSWVNSSPRTYTKALFASIGRTWRKVDNTFNPRHGQITQLDLGGASRAALSDQNFVRMYGKHQRWIPVGKRDVLILRAEGGYVLAPDDDGIPEDYLFRAGGSSSVRGYAYQSLGVEQDGGVVGGRILTTASIEYVHWLTGKGGNWGAAGFLDVGDAADRVTDLSMKQGVGFGARYKTPAGPLAVDLAYGLQARQVRLDFFIGIAF